MIKDADRGLKDRFGGAAYVWTGARDVRNKPTRTKVSIDGQKWFDGDASCVLVANVSDIMGGITRSTTQHRTTVSSTSRS